MSKKERTIGSISGWDSLTTNTTEQNTIPSSEHDFTIEDLFLQMKKLRDMFNPENMDYIENLVNSHVHNFENPHRTDLDQLNTSVIQELYSLWMSEGNSGTREEFLKVLFQYVRIADINTTIIGTAQDQVPSVKGVATVVSNHNTDPDSHSTIFAGFFPGEELLYPPSFVLEPLVGLPYDAVVTRNSNISYINSLGLLSESTINTLPADYSFGDPVFPLFGSIVNDALYSEDFSNPYWVKNNTVVNISTSILDPTGLNAAQVLQETTSVSPIEYSINNGSNITLVENQLICLSFFVKPAGRQYVGFRVDDSVVGEYGFVHFDLENATTYQNAGSDSSRIFGKIVKLATGWCRLCVFLRPKVSGTLLSHLYLLDILDGDFTYTGTNGLGVALFGGMICSNVSDIPPYIKTTTTPVAMDKTLLSIPSTSWFSPLQGTVVLELSNVIPLPLSESKELYSIASSDGANVALNAVFNMTHNSQLYCRAFKSGNGALVNRLLSSYPRAYRNIAIHSYNQLQHEFKSLSGNTISVDTNATLNPTVNTLFLGTNRYGLNPFNGYLKRFMYYGYKCNTNNFNFFLGA